MTDNEAICTAIVTGATAFGGLVGAAIRVAVRAFQTIAASIVKAVDDSTAEWKETNKTVRVLVNDIAEIKQHVNIEKKIDAAVEAVVEEVSGVHEAANTDLPRRDTPRGGYAIQKPRRAQTRGNGGVL